MLLDGRSQVNRIGRLESMARPQLGRPLDDGGGNVGDHKAPALEEGVVLGKKLLVGISSWFHAAFEAGET